RRKFNGRPAPCPCCPFPSHVARAFTCRGDLPAPSLRSCPWRIEKPKTEKENAMPRHKTATEILDEMFKDIADYYAKQQLTCFEPDEMFDEAPEVAAELRRARDGR